jgi:hypothetical protein
MIIESNAPRTVRELERDIEDSYHAYDLMVAKIESDMAHGEDVSPNEMSSAGILWQSIEAMKDRLALLRKAAAE